MRAFVTGSTGPLGNNLVRTLLKAGHEVGRFGQIGSEGARELGDTSARIVIGDMADVAVRPRVATCARPQVRQPGRRIGRRLLRRSRKPTCTS